MHTQSLAIESVAYDESARLLRMRYRDSGRTVVYEGVPQELYDLLIFSDSICGFIREKIEGHYPVRRNQDASANRR